MKRFNRHHLMKLLSYLKRLRGKVTERMVLCVKYDWGLMRGKERGEVRENGVCI